MHLSTSGSTEGSCFRLARWAFGSALMMTPGLSRSVGIGKLLQPPHDLVGVAAPLGFDERRHVAAGAVLGFQRAIVAMHDHDSTTSSMKRAY